MYIVIIRYEVDGGRMRRTHSRDRRNGRRLDSLFDARITPEHTMYDTEVHLQCVFRTI